MNISDLFIDSAIVLKDIDGKYYTLKEEDTIIDGWENPLVVILSKKDKISKKDLWKYNGE